MIATQVQYRLSDELVLVWGDWVDAQWAVWWRPAPGKEYTVGRGATAASALWRASDVAPGRLRETLLSAARRSEGLPVYPALSRGRVAEVAQQPPDLA